MMTDPAEKQQRFYGWWILASLCIIYGLLIGFVYYGPPVLYPFMAKALAWSRGKISIGYTILGLVNAVAGPFVGIIISRYGAKRIIVLGIAVISVSTLLLGFTAHSYAAYIILSCFMSIGLALTVAISIPAIVMFWFERRRALAIGLVSVGGALGGFFAPQAMSSIVLNMGENWRVGWFMMSIAAFVTILIAIFAVRNKPSDMGQYPDGLPPDTGTQTPLEAQKLRRIYKTTDDWTLKESFKSRSLWLLIIAQGAVFYTWLAVISQGPFHLEDRGIDVTTASFFYSLAIGLSVLGRLTVAALGDRIEPRYLMAFGLFCILTGGVMFWFASPANMWAAYLYPLLVGFGFGASMVCLLAIIGNYWGEKAFPKIFGMLMPILMIFQGGTPLFAGYLHDVQGSYFTVMVVAWVLAFIGMCAMLICTPPDKRQLAL
jgi:MFS family permease